MGTRPCEACLKIDHNVAEPGPPNGPQAHHVWMKAIIWGTLEVYVLRIGNRRIGIYCEAPTVPLINVLWIPFGGGYQWSRDSGREPF